MKDESLDLIITSPPYNVNLGDNKYKKQGYDVYKDNREHAEYIGWLKNIFGMICAKSKDSARLCINIGDGQNGRVPTHSDIIQAMCQIGWRPYATIMWDKNTTSARTAWGSFQSPSCPSFPSPYEYILIFYKNDKNIGKGETDLTKEEFVEWAYGKWTFPCNKNKNHPAAFPEELPKRLIKMLSYPGATVYDPFAGSGTTCKAAKDLKRQFIGSEISEEYFNIAKKRIDGEQNCRNIDSK